MATRLAFAAISRAPPAPPRVASALKAPCQFFNAHTPPYRGIVAAAHISSSACSRTSTRTTHGGNSITAPSSTAPGATSDPAATPQSSGGAAVGTDAGDAGVQGSSEAAAGPSTSSDPSANGSGGGGGGGGDGGSRGPLTWGAVGLLGIVATLAVGYYRMKWEEKQNRTASEVGHVVCVRAAERSYKEEVNQPTAVDSFSP